MYSEELEALISAALADDCITEKERQVLIKRAEAEGVDRDEFELVLDSRIILANKKKTTEQKSLSVTHPGITFTGITAHYPTLIFAIIKHPMKIIFMKPKIACLSILKGVFDSCEDNVWIGPEFFNIWGLPAKKPLTCDESERKYIGTVAENIHNQLIERNFKNDKRKCKVYRSK